MSGLSRRAFLGFSQTALCVVTVGAIGGSYLIETAAAMPVASDLGEARNPPDDLTEAQWGPGPGWGRPPPPRRRRRWVCWWHRGRRRCGWRWR
jgi:hypothetical protein